MLSFNKMKFLIRRNGAVLKIKCHICVRVCAVCAQSGNKSNCVLLNL